MIARTARFWAGAVVVALACVILSSCTRLAVRESTPTADPSIAIPSAALDKLAAGLEQDSAVGFDFPWSELETQISKEPNGRLMLVGYGSLMSLESAAETIHGVNEQDFFPVVCAGAKRVFNYRIPDDVLEELGGSVNPDERAALNVVATGRATDLINGRILPVGVGDFPDLRQREFGYHLRPVICLQWDAPQAEPFTAYMLAAEDPIVNGRQVIDNTLVPNPAYVEIGYTGAKSVSEEFAELFLDTSFLADGTTSLRQWLNSRR